MNGMCYDVLAMKYIRGHTMKVTVYADYSKINEVHLRNSTVIVVDVLRTSSSIVWAVQNGAHQVIPALDPGEAAAFSMQIGRSESLLAGERGGLQLPGFDLGNSPLEFAKEVVGDKTVIISTSNGTGAIHCARNADVLLIGAMINRTAVAEYALQMGKNIVILCAGTDGMFSADDICCAGAIVDALQTGAQRMGLALDCCDLSCVSHLLYRDFVRDPEILCSTAHYQTLEGLGLADDLSFCFEQDVTDIVPIYRDGVIVQA